MTRILLAGEKINDPLAMYAGDIMTVLNTFISFVDVDLCLPGLCSKYLLTRNSHTTLNLMMEI